MSKKRLSLRERWRFWRLDAVRRYYIKLKHNTTHPFDDLGDGFYYITVWSDKFLFGCGLITFTATAFILFTHYIGFYSFPLALTLITIAYGIFSMYGHLSTKELILSRHGGYLMRIKGTQKVLVEEPIHNCYIKLMRKYDSNLEPHFYLILGGYNLDDIRISSMGDEDGALRLLGSRLAETMGINYFDYDNNSTLHRLIHYPTFSTLRATDEDYKEFLEEHFLSKQEVMEAMDEEDLHHTTTLPEAISAHVTENYKIGSRIGKGETAQRRNQSYQARMTWPKIVPNTGKPNPNNF